MFFQAAAWTFAVRVTTPSRSKMTALNCSEEMGTRLLLDRICFIAITSNPDVLIHADLFVDFICKKEVIRRKGSGCDFEVFTAVFAGSVNPSNYKA